MQTFRLRDDDGKQLRIFNKILAWDPTELGMRRTIGQSARQGRDMNDTVNESELSAPEEIKSFRADAARGNYLSMARPPQFGVKETSRAMSKPMKKDQRRIARMGKYLKDLENRRVKQEFKFERRTPSSRCTE